MLETLLMWIASIINHLIPIYFCVSEAYNSFHSRYLAVSLQLLYLCASWFGSFCIDTVASISLTLVGI